MLSIFCRPSKNHVILCFANRMHTLQCICSPFETPSPGGSIATRHQLFAFAYSARSPASSPATSNHHQLRMVQQAKRAITRPASSTKPTTQPILNLYERVRSRNRRDVYCDRASIPPSFGTASTSTTARLISPSRGEAFS
jgi:hypothetical protein